MRVLHVLKDLSRNGGVQRLVFDLAGAAERMGWTTEVAIFRREAGHEYVDALRARGVTVHVLAPWQLLRQWRLYRGADVVHAHLFPALYLVGLLCPGSIYTEHNTTNNRRKLAWLRPVERWMYARFRRVTCISPEVRDALLSYLGQAHSADTVLVYNGVDVDSLSMHAQNLRHAAGLRRAGFHVAMLGSLTPKKDQAALIRAIALLPADVELHLAGDGPERAALVELARTSGVASRVHFDGVIEDVAAWLVPMDLHVQSSKWEGFGLSAIEAMACGVPALCSDVPGLNNLAVDKSILFPQGDAAQLAHLVSRCRNDAEFRQQLCWIGRETAAKYSVARMATAMNDQYKAALAPGGQHI
jgi:glycosyltransferase involved in cell wall biosynthesis